MKFNFKSETDREIIENEIARFRNSAKRRLMIMGENYYNGRHDILNRGRTVIGREGELIKSHNLPDNRVVDNQYRKIVNQKTNYLLGRPLTFRTDSEKQHKYLSNMLDKGFMRLFKNVCKDAYNSGISYVYPYINRGKLSFKRLRGYEVIPGWRDFEHTELDYAIRLHEVVECTKQDGDKVDKAGERGKNSRRGNSAGELKENEISYVEVFDESGIHYFKLNEDDKLVPIHPYHNAYVTDEETSLAFDFGGRIPLVAFKRDNDECPLIAGVKTLQDGLNLIMSNFLNAMEDDPHNTVLVLVNYDGDDLGEFRENLSRYGAVRVQSIDGAMGDIKTLNIEVNAENYRAIIEVFKKAIIENGMGFDAKDSRFSGNMNQMNIQSMYSDIDLDANEIETEFQSSLEQLMEFAACPAFSRCDGLCDSPVEFIFNRDMMLNEGAIIENCVNSLEILSKETVIANHPWVDNVMDEVLRKKNEENQIQNQS